MAQRYVGIFNFEQKLEGEQDIGFIKLAETTITISRIGSFPGYTVMNKQFYHFFPRKFCHILERRNSSDHGFHVI